MDKVTVSVIVPIRNEEQYIAGCLTSLVEQTLPPSAYEIIVVDGRSSDRSRQIVERFQSRCPNMRCLDNAAGIASAAMNIGIRNAAGKFIVRADGHNCYPADYVANCIRYLEKTGADNVGGPWRTIPSDSSLRAKLVAAILTNPFGVGDSSFRTSCSEGYVETVPFGAFRRELFDRVGWYNEKLVRNQDNELNARIRQTGGKIYQTPALTTEYHPIADLFQLLKQTFKTSQWHLYSMRENIRSLSLRHLIPAAFVFSLLSLSLVSFFSHVFLIALLSLVLLYLLVALYFAVRRSRSYGILVLSCFPLAVFAFHAAYGAGTLVGLRYIVGTPSSNPIRAGQPVSPGGSQ